MLVARCAVAVAALCCRSEQSDKVGEIVEKLPFKDRAAILRIAEEARAPAQRVARVAVLR